MATLQEQMAANSAAWNGATPEVQAQLNEANLGLASQLGLGYNSASGEYSRTMESAQAQINNNPNMSISEIIAMNQTNSGHNPNSFENLQGAYGSGIQNFTQQQVDTLQKGDPTGYTNLTPTGIDGVSIDQNNDTPSTNTNIPTNKPNIPITSMKNGVVANFTPTPNRIDYAALLREALNNNKPLAPTDNSSSIEQSIAAKLKAILAKNQANVNQGVSDQNAIIQGVDQKYQPQINDSEVAKNNQLRSVLEQSANAGDRGGIGRQNALETQTQGDNRLNNIRLAIQGVKDQATKTIADLQSAGRSNEAIAEAESASEKIQLLIGESNRIDAINRENSNTGYSRALDVLKFGADQQNEDRNFDYNSSQDIIRNAMSEAGLTGQYNGAKTVLQQAQEKEQARQDRLDKEKATTDQKNEYASLMANLGDNIDYSTERDKILNDGDPTNDWKSLILNQERQKKMDKQKEADAVARQQEELNRQKQSQLEQDRLFNEARIKDMLKPSDSDPNSDLDRLYKQAQIDALNKKTYETKNQVDATTFNRYVTVAKSMMNDESGVGGRGLYSVEDVRKYILGLNLPDDVTDALLGSVNLPINQQGGII